jgi:hypothetical protein
LRLALGFFALLFGLLIDRLLYALALSSASRCGWNNSGGGGATGGLLSPQPASSSRVMAIAARRDVDFIA